MIFQGICSNLYISKAGLYITLIMIVFVLLGGGCKLMIIILSWKKYTKA